MKNYRYFIPVPIKKFLKYILYTLEDFFSWTTGSYNVNYPPKRLNFVGSHDFKKVGNEFVKLFQNLGNLDSSDAVLDIGCGIGRMAIPLAKFLNKNGKYEGFDIDKRGVDWCTKNITSKFPNFRFQYVDLYNKYYNSHGKILAKDFVFPYEENTFDFIFATSVFTHMLPEDVENYLSEISRVLKPNGKFFLTFFVLNKKTEKLMKEGKSQADFQYILNKNSNKSPDTKLQTPNSCYYSHKNNIEAETAYQEEWIKEKFKAKNLKNPKIHYGWWRGEKGVSYQDIITTENLND